LPKCLNCGKYIETEGILCEECRRKKAEEGSETIEPINIEDLEPIELEEEEEIEKMYSIIESREKDPFICFTGVNGFGALELSDDIIKLIQRDNLTIKVSNNEFKIKNWDTVGKVISIYPNLKDFISLLKLFVYKLEPRILKNSFNMNPRSKDSKILMGYILVPGHNFVEFDDIKSGYGVFPLVTQESYSEIEKNIDENIKPIEFSYNLDSDNVIDKLRNSKVMSDLGVLQFLINEEIKFEIPIALKIQMEDAVIEIEDEYSRERHNYILKLAQISDKIEDSISKEKIKHWNKNLNFERYEKDYFKYVKPIIDEWNYKKEEYLYRFKKFSDYYEIKVSLENRTNQQFLMKDFIFEKVEIKFPSDLQNIDLNSICTLVINSEAGTFESESEIYDPINNRISWTNFKLSTPKSSKSEKRIKITSTSKVSKIEDKNYLELINKPSKIYLCFYIKKNFINKLDNLIIELKGTYGENIFQLINEIYYITPMGFPVYDLKKGINFIPLKRIYKINLGESSHSDIILPIPKPTKSDSYYGFNFSYDIDLKRLATNWKFRKIVIELIGIQCDEVYDNLKDIILKLGANITWEKRPIELIHSKIIGLKEYYGEILASFIFEEVNAALIYFEITGEGKRDNITGVRDKKSQRTKIILHLKYIKENLEYIENIINSIHDKFSNNIKSTLKSLNEED